MRHFLSDPIDPAVLARLLEAAHRGRAWGSCNRGVSCASQIAGCGTGSTPSSRRNASVPPRSRAARRGVPALEGRRDHELRWAPDRGALRWTRGACLRPPQPAGAGPLLDRLRHPEPVAGRARRRARHGVGVDVRSGSAPVSSGSPRAETPWRSCASVMSRRSIPHSCWRCRAGPAPARCTSWCCTTPGGTRPFEGFIPLIRRLIRPVPFAQHACPAPRADRRARAGPRCLLALGQIGRDAEPLVSLEAIASGLTLDQAHHRERINWPLLRLALPPGRNLPHLADEGPKKSSILSRGLACLTAHEPSSTVSLDENGRLFFLYLL